MSDIDGNIYPTMGIGYQMWMAENLKTTKYNDGTAIEYPGTNTAAWANNITGAFAWYDNDEATNKDLYGALYNWYAVNTGKLCPLGWHIFTDAEWTAMENYLIANGYNYDGSTSGNKIAKSLAATTNWISSTALGAPGNTDYSMYRNKTGFTALPGGYRFYYEAYFSEIGIIGYWWSASEGSTGGGRGYYLRNYDNYTTGAGGSKHYGYSVRCIKD
jgi:uncharacterized protein (TIGR02145 family)